MSSILCLIINIYENIENCVYLNFDMSIVAEVTH